MPDALVVIKAGDAGIEQEVIAMHRPSRSRLRRESQAGAAAARHAVGKGS